MDTSRLVNPIAPGDYVQSLDKGLAVIRAFGHERRAMTLSEVAKVTGLSKPSARRFLLTLHALGYVSHQAGQFRLQPRVLDLGSSYLTSAELPEVVNPFLLELNANVREACSVGVLDGDEAVYIARASSQRKIMTFNVQIGTRLDPVITALGRVLLADLDSIELAAYLDGRRTRDTLPPIDTGNQLSIELKKVRETGWCLMDQEIEAGVRTIAAPIRNASGQVIAGINVAAHAARVSRERLENEFLPALLDTAEQINASLAEFDAGLL